VVTGPRWRVARWVVAVAVLALAAGVALWPRGSDVNPGPAAVSAPEPDLAAMRAKAALAPCPEGGASTGAGVASPLDGIVLPCLGGDGAVPLRRALAGADALLNIWSHTCGPCRDELSTLQEYAARPGAIRVLEVQVDGSPQAGLGLLAALDVHLPAVTDPDGTLRAALGAPQVLPLSYFVGADGSVRMVNPPVVFASADEVDAVVRGYQGRP
jgi:thiol-disulfide isomerase/thioredoxin